MCTSTVRRLHLSLHVLCLFKPNRKRIKNLSIEQDLYYHKVLNNIEVYVTISLTKLVFYFMKLLQQHVSFTGAEKYIFKKYLEQYLQSALYQLNYYKKKNVWMIFVQFW